MLRTLAALAVVVGMGLAVAVYAGPAMVFVAPQSASASASGYHVDAPAPALTARSWGLYDLETGERIIAHKPQEVRPIASVTKLLTAAVASGMFPEGETTTVSRTAVATEGRAGSLTEGETLSFTELLFPLLLESSNDAAEVFAEARGRDVFLGSMNFAAVILDMMASRFADPSGLSPENVSTADDLALLLRHLSMTAPQLLGITRLSRYVGAEHVWTNVNPVADANGFIGGKHGYTPEAGRTLAMLLGQPFDSQTRTLALVLLGSENLAHDVAALRAYVAAHVRYE